MSYFHLEMITHRELGETTSRSIAGRFDTRADALGAAIDLAQELAGPVRDDYRRMTISIVRDDYLGMTVRVGDATVDAEYHVFYTLESGRKASDAPTGRGYVISHV